ncbi:MULTISPECIES: Mu transposase C-terminal domain-containing protein [unclassified Desulfovibrio]|uniref:Mu transposase C-terminal domain-containing protein n=1 Tax=unclassified Desulfovibrio TaxID=2593640 RepID=UPI0013EE2C50|nr:MULTISPECIES: Mu transposase C-terminal domain-containing protein [unclassified Desulfovibrio]
MLDVSVKNALKRAQREGWNSRARVGKGGGHEWIVSSMPEPTRLAIAAKVCASTTSLAVTHPAASMAAPVSGPAHARHGAPGGAGAAASLTTLSGSAKRRADARIEATLAARTFAANSGLPYTVALSTFARRYNAGEIVLSEATRAELPALNMSSLRRWDSDAKAEGVAVLGGKYGRKTLGTGCIDRQDLVVNTILGMVRQYPNASATVIRQRIEALAHKGIDVEVPSLRRLQSWIANWKATHRSLLAYITAPDKWRGSYQSATGVAYEALTEYNERWEYDGTPADLMLKDGKRYTIVGIINCYSREVKFEVAERSTGRTVANLTRRCILDWGVPRVAVTDNGKEFVSNTMQGLFLDLGIIPDVLPPFQPCLKPAIERVFRTFSHHLLPICPCYLGHNVATRQQIRERETFAKRLMSSTADQLTMAITPEELQEFCDAWADDVYRHTPHSGFRGALRGLTPWQVRQSWTGEVRRLTGEQERALDVLLMDSGWREITKKGIRLDGMRYDAAALGPHVGERAQVRVDPTDRTRAWIFDENGDFLGVANEVSGLALEERMQLAKEKRRKQMAAITSARKVLDAAAQETDAEHAAADIMAMYKDRARAIEAAAGPAAPEVVEHESEALEAAAQAVHAVEEPASLGTGVDVAAALEIARASLAQAEATNWLPEHPQEKYALWKRLKARQAAGESLTAEQVEWLQIYTESNEFRGFALIDPEQVRAVNE